MRATISSLVDYSNSFTSLPLSILSPLPSIFKVATEATLLFENRFSHSSAQNFLMSLLWDKTPTPCCDLQDLVFIISAFPSLLLLSPLLTLLQPHWPFCHTETDQVQSYPRTFSCTLSSGTILPQWGLAPSFLSHSSLKLTFSSKPVSLTPTHHITLPAFFLLLSPSYFLTMYILLIFYLFSLSSWM